MIESIQYISLIQAFIIGIILFFFKKNQQYHFRYIAFFLVLLSLGILNELCTSYLGNEYHPLTAFNFHLLLPNLIYLHICSNMSLLISKKKILINLIPGAIEFILLVSEAFAVTYGLIDVDSLYLDYFYDAYTLISIIYVVCIQVLIFKMVFSYNNYLYEYFSTINYKYLNWLKWVCILIIVNEIYYCIFYFTPFESSLEDYYYATYVIIELVIVYYVSINSLIQINVSTKIDIPNEETIKKIHVQNEDLNLKKEFSEPSELFKQIEEYLKLHKPYLNPDLNLKSLARLLEIPQRELSKTINSFSGTNFHGYINKYRIEEVKRILEDTNFDNFSIVGIGEEAGFNSKSSFYNNFKKEVGVSPIEYRTKNL